MFALHDLAVRFGSVEALAPTTLSIGTGETLVLLGPSGSGKSTLLRALIGLSPFTGRLTFERAPVTDWHQVRRRMGYVIQDGGLFPHLTARRNVTLMARELGWTGERMAARVTELAELVGLDAGQLDRYPSALSGGQRQRVALMRALMLDPAVLLLDEPLSALDPVTKVRLAGELRSIFARLGKTVVMVTHSLGEARFFGGRALMMRAGRVVQEGAIEDLTSHPADAFRCRIPRRRGRAVNRLVTAVLHAATAVLTMLMLTPAAFAGDAQHSVVIASKKFTESVILGEMARLTLERAGIPATHKRELGGSRIVYDALAAGDIDVYPDYTGTLRYVILSGEHLTSDAQLTAALGKRGLAMSRPLGFNNTYAMVMRSDLARKLGISTLSDLARHPQLTAGISNEFVDRADGWPALSAAYHLSAIKMRGMDHDLAYRALSSGQIDVTDGYATDAEIAAYHLTVLRDDKAFFPAYDAVFVYRQDLPQAAKAALNAMAGTITLPEMQQLNRMVRIDHASETAAARKALGMPPRTDAGAGLWQRLFERTREHLALVAIALAGAILAALPIGILAARLPRLGAFLIPATGLLQTIPSLALFVMLIPLLGIGAAPTIAALFLYSLLPIVRNTHAGLTGIAPSLIDSAEALGLSSLARLRRIELPLALPTILAGVRTAAVIAVGLATLGAIIGAGGYGQPILTGIRLGDNRLILEGALPAAIMALCFEGLFHLIEQWLKPRGLRAPPGTGE